MEKGSNDVLEDAVLIEQVLLGDLEKYEALVFRYKECVFKRIAKHVPYSMVEDVAQETFLKAFKSLKSYAFKAPFEHWITRIALRSAYDVLRKSSKESILDKNLSEEVKNASLEYFSSDNEVQNAKELIQRTLKSLSAEDQMIVSLLYLEDWKIKDVAKILDWSVVRVKVRAFRCKKIMRSMIEELNQ